MYTILETISLMNYLEPMVHALGWSLLVTVLFACINYLYDIEKGNI